MCGLWTALRERVFDGRIESDSVYINPNPKNPENYVELAGEIKNEKFSGDWRWFEPTVNSNRGNFKAVGQYSNC